MDYTSQKARMGAYMAIALAFAVGCSSAHNAAQGNRASTPAPAEEQAKAPLTPEEEHKRVLGRFEDPRHQALLGNASGNALQVGEEPLNELVHTVFVDLKDSGSFDFEASVRNAGGIDAFKKRIASYLTSTDVTARAVAALALAIVGDQQYVEQLVGLLRNKELRVHAQTLEGFDRGMAMLALALLKATKYRPEIESYASSTNQNDSEGAKAALEVMDH